MRAEKRSHWYRWACDLETCEMVATSHPAIGDPDPPFGWVVVHPPAFWRGAALAFCSREHHEQWARATVGMLMLGSGS